jgi:hypothetical protein
MMNWLGDNPFAGFTGGGLDFGLRGYPEGSHVTTGSEKHHIHVFKNAEKFNHDEWDALVSRTEGDKSPV